MNNLPEPETYEIRVRGHLDPRWAQRLGVPNLTINEDGTTALAGIAADQATLHGLLQRIRDLGMTLVSVTSITTDQQHHETKSGKSK